MADGYYYLHENGSLLYKRDLGDTAADLAESPFVKRFWGMDTLNRADAWTVLVEALALGVDKARVEELAAWWGCDDTDAEEYAARLGLTFDIDGDAWCVAPPWFVNLAESPAGFGDTKLIALAELAVSLGIRDQPGATFAGLLGTEAA